MCWSPLTLKKAYRGLDNSFTDIVPCGKCFECLALRRNSWAFRLHHQSLVSDTTYFITLTYGVNNESGSTWGTDEPRTPNGHGTLSKIDVQLFLKRLRKRQKTYFPDAKPIKYYACGEYGTLHLRPHYHLIMFNLEPFYALRSEFVAKNIWTHGKVDIVPSNLSTINYTVGYVMKGSWKPFADSECNFDELTGEILSDDRQPEFGMMSKNLGLSYLDEATWDYHLDRMIGYVEAPNGALLAMPRYYRDKIFSKEEKLELRKEAEMIRQFDWETFANIDYDHEAEKKKSKLRTFEKQQILKRLKL